VTTYFLDSPGRLIDVSNDQVTTDGPEAKGNTTLQSGVDPLQAQNFLTAPYNNFDIVSQIIKDNKDEIGGMIIEPLQRCTSPESGFLEGLRDITQQHDIPLIFDEVVTCFRLAYGGAQAYYGVKPDLIAYGKALGGRYPIGAFGGLRDIMQITGENRMNNDTYVWSASTLGENPISSSVARTALSILSEIGVYYRLHELGKYLRTGLKRVLDDNGIAAQVIGDGPLAQSVITDRTTVNDYRSSQHKDGALARKISLGLFERGIFLNPMGTKLYISIAHDETVCDEFLDRFDDTLKSLI
jgi:glutamate-1-semialdehyde 2,1-aminomutase